MKTRPSHWPSYWPDPRSGRPLYWILLLRKCSDMHQHQLIFCGLEPWSSHLSGPQSVPILFLDKDQAKPLVYLKFKSSIILDSSSIRMSTRCPVVMQWKCSDMHHHRLIFCGLEPWSRAPEGTHFSQGTFDPSYIMMSCIQVCSTAIKVFVYKS